MTLLEFQTPGNQPHTMHSAHEVPTYRDYDSTEQDPEIHTDLDFEPDFETEAELSSSRLAWEALAKNLRK